MSAFWLSLAVQAVKMLLGSAVFQSLVAQVVRLAKTDMTGAAKRAALLEWARVELADAPEKLIRAALELYLLNSKK